jgi:hypothetical protein
LEELSHKDFVTGKVAVKYHGNIPHPKEVIDE